MRHVQHAVQRAIPALLIAMTACTPRAAVEPVPTVEPVPPVRAVEPVPPVTPVQPVAPAAHPADVKFMQDMIGHHAQALVMAGMAPTHGASDMVQKLARKIDISQKDEIRMMKDWLTERSQSVPDESHHMHMQMPGMLNAEQMAQLDAARGREFDRLFLTFMIQHHEGALHMVNVLFQSPGAAQDSDVFRFASDVSADQSDEIDVMYRMLDMLAANREEDR